MGKSTLLNLLVGQKVSIVSHKSQTTRQNITGILIGGNAQIAFTDTPGISYSRRAHDRRLVTTAWTAIAGIDIVVLMISAASPLTSRTEEMIGTFGEFTQTQCRRILAINKIDRIQRHKLLPLTARLSSLLKFDAVFMISAKTGDGVDDLRKWMVERAPPGAWLYEEDQVANLSMQFLACEITREGLFHRLHQELPYQLTVETEQWKENADGSVSIRQCINVPRISHKKVVVGSRGSVIREIGKLARKEIADLLGKEAHLFLHVRVRTTAETAASSNSP